MNQKTMCQTGRCKKGEKNGRELCELNENGRCVKKQSVKRIRPLKLKHHEKKQLQ